MVWIEPLNLEVWIVNVFAGTPEIFTAIALLVIMGMAGYFRMTGFSMFFMIITFLLMFGGVVPASLIIFISIFGGLIGGLLISNMFTR